MRLRRVGRAFPWRTSLLTALALSLVTLTSWAWFTWELPPLERYYLGAYWDSSENQKNPEAVVEIQWLELTAPNRRSQWAIDSFVTNDSFGDFPIELSSHALAQGWTGIEKSSPYLVSAAQLEGILRPDFYHGRSFREVVGEPTSYVCIIAFAVLLIAWKMRYDIESEWRDVWQAVWESESVWDSGWNLPSNRHANLAQIRSRMAQGFAALTASIERFRSKVLKSHLSAANLRANSPTVLGHNRSLLRADYPGTSTAQRISNPAPTSDTNTESYGHLVFPGSSSSYIRTKDSEVWHESEWID